LLQIFSYSQKFVLVVEKRRTFLRWKRVSETREKMENQEMEITEKSIKKNRSVKKIKFFPTGKMTYCCYKKTK
jgi:hypothetical protein